MEVRPLGCDTVQSGTCLLINTLKIDLTDSPEEAWVKYLPDYAKSRSKAHYPG
jgi:hypothetical protein